MLGRLFNSRSVDLDAAPPSGSPGRHTNMLLMTSISQENGPAYNNEDSYSRTVLYGTPNAILAPQLAQHNFRILLVQDKGEIIQRDNHRVLFDSARDHHFDKPHAKLANRHTTSELLEFMFGNPIHQDFHYTGRVKVHVLSSMQDLKHSMLVSSHFTAGKRVFAIGIVIPVTVAEFAQCIVPNWPHLMRNVNVIQRSFLENHVGKKDAQVNYLDIAILFKQLVASLCSLVTIPRLLLGITQVDGVFQNWCYEVNNWIEIKDGARLGSIGTKFLTTLLTIVNSVKKQLVEDDSRELVRVVIMAVSPIVVQKLIFIISGILPYNVELKIQDQKTESKLLKDTFHIKPSMPIASRQSPPAPSVINKGWEIPNTPSRSMATASVMTPSRQSVIQPLSTSSSMAQLSSSLHSHSSFSSSLTRGFQMLQSWKNSLDSASSSNGSVQSYRSPSPSTEYEEYPWNKPVYVSQAQPLQPHSLPRTMSTFDLTQNMGKLKRTTPKLPHIERTAINVLKVGDSNISKQQRLAEKRRELLELMQRPVSTTLEYDPIKAVSVLNVEYDTIDSAESTTLKPLAPLCGYISDFSPGFALQACPLAPELESKVSTAMRADLNYYQQSRTVFVSLRAREVREFVMYKSQSEYKQQVKKSYTNFKPGACVDKEMFARVERLLQAVGDCDGSSKTMSTVRRQLERL